MSDSKELATQSGREVANDALATAGAMLDKMMALALDPSVDAGKFETIARVVKETRDDAKREQFAIAKANALLEMPVIDKRGRITIADKTAPNDRSKDRVQGTFAKWPDLQRAIAPVLARYDLYLTHKIGHSEAMTTVIPVLGHRNGHVEEGSEMKLPLDTSGGKNNTQGAGSAASYGKRHTTLAFLGIRVEDSDDDGALFATIDEPLNDQQQRRVDEATARAAEGGTAYAEWFKKLEPKDRAWMIQTGRHAQFGGEAPTLNAPVDKTKAEPKQAPSGQTPEQWVERYEGHLKDAADLDTLAAIQTRGKRTMDSLKERGLTDLYQRAVRAGSDAVDRLRGVGGDMFGGDE